ncbi:MAG: protein arginine kinase [Peptococcaceae bacterium]|nr:protein arginine kinase [Peptococcaceae bacterium]
MTAEKHFTTIGTKWTETANHNIVLSTRVRLARNIAGLPFPQRMTEAERQELLAAVGRAMQNTPLGQKGYRFFRGEELTVAERELLLEKHLISPQFAGETGEVGILISDDESLVIMIGEEDHVRIQSFLPGLQLSAALAGSNQVDDWLEQGLDWAFDDKIGYLTACPSNVGTGLRASVMVHLPALALTGRLEQIFAAMGKLGLTVRGIYGEGSESLGALYQISNQVTLGYREEEILARLETVINQIAAEEEKARQWLKEQQTVKLHDMIWRAYGTTSFARTLSLGEMMDCLSQLRLGVDLGILKEIDKEQLNKILIGGQDHFLTKEENRELSANDINILRAEFVRKIMQDDATNSATQ